MLRIFFIRLRSWEFWPSWLANVPTVGFWLFYAVRARSLFFFSRVNPAIETGGVFGESKWNILRNLPNEVLPKTLVVQGETRAVDAILDEMTQAGLHFPVIAKPDVGERGFRVEKLTNQAELRYYFSEYSGRTLVQEYVDYPVEMSVLYHRFSGSDRGKVTSVCIKKMLAVTGDGRSSIETLMTQNARAVLQLKRFREHYPQLLTTVLPEGVTQVLEPIGNHCRGTTFLNGNDLISERLTAVFDRIHRSMEGMCYGRFDLRCQSIEDLHQGKNFRILEFNGIASEPAHIYDPEYPVWSAYRDLHKHWQIIYEISKVQKSRGIETMTWRELLTSVQKHRKRKRSASSASSSQFRQSNKTDPFQRSASDRTCSLETRPSGDNVLDSTGPVR